MATSSAMTIVVDLRVVEEVAAAATRTEAAPEVEASEEVRVEFVSSVCFKFRVSK